MEAFAQQVFENALIQLSALSPTQSKISVTIDAEKDGAQPAQFTTTVMYAIIGSMMAKPLRYVADFHQKLTSANAQSRHNVALTYLANAAKQLSLIKEQFGDVATKGRGLLGSADAVESLGQVQEATMESMKSALVDCLRAKATKGVQPLVSALPLMTATKVVEMLEKNDKTKALESLNSDQAKSFRKAWTQFEKMRDLPKLIYDAMKSTQSGTSLEIFCSNAGVSEESIRSAAMAQATAVVVQACLTEPGKGGTRGSFISIAKQALTTIGVSAEDLPAAVKSLWATTQAEQEASTPRKRKSDSTSSSQPPAAAQPARPLLKKEKKEQL